MLSLNNIKLIHFNSNVLNLHSTPSNYVIMNSYDLNMLKCVKLALNTFKSYPLTLEWPQYAQMCTIALNNLKSLKFDFLQLKYSSIHSNHHSCIKYAFKNHKHVNQHLQPPNVDLYTSNLQTSKHQPMPQTYSNAPPIRSTLKAPPNTKTSQDPLLIELAIKSLTL